MSVRQRRFPWLSHCIVLLLIMAFALSPVIALAVINANQPGAPMRLTDLMASWGMLGWLATLPFALGGFFLLLWIFVVPLHYFVWRRRQNRTES